MLPLSEIVGLGETLDDQGRSDVADAAGAPWDLAAGAARFWRSSASHVFVVPHAASPNGTAYLRFVPQTWRPRERLVAVAELMRHLGQLGPGVASPLLSSHGRLVETVDTPRGGVHTMLVAAAPGEQVDGEAVYPAQARAWGAALARLHRHGGSARVQLPDPFADLHHARSWDRDAPLADVVARLRAALAELPRDDSCFGVVHGDFELDNLAWVGDEPTAFDFDDAGRSWFAADIAHALRDVLSPSSAVAQSPIAVAFLAGYRSMRALSDVELSWLPLFTAAQAAVWLGRLPAIVDRDPSPDDPPWLAALHTKLRRSRTSSREMIYNSPPI